jgi:hypothetical protein
MIEMLGVNPIVKSLRRLDKQTLKIGWNAHYKSSWYYEESSETNETSEDTDNTMIQNFRRKVFCKEFETFATQDRFETALPNSTKARAVLSTTLDKYPVVFSHHGGF